MNTLPPPPAPSPNRPPGQGQGRARGWALIVLGLGLSVAMSVVTWSLHQAIALQASPGSRSRWHGGPEFTRTTFELFGAIFLFGLFCTGAGTFQACTGRRHRATLILALLLAATMVYLGYEIVTAVEPGR